MKLTLSPVPAALLSALSLCACATYAQTMVQLPDTVVVASRSAQPLSEVAADVDVIGRADIERLGVSTLGELLAGLPGVQATRHGDATRVYLRGAEARMTALYIDGVRMDSQDGLSLGGGAPWDLVPLSQIERVEVLRGPASAVYGSDAMGGVVQVFTRAATGARTAYANLSLASLSTQRVDAGLRAGAGAWSLALGMAVANSEGYNTRPDLVHQPEREPRRERALNARLGWEVAGGHAIELLRLSQRQESAYVPWGGGTDYASHASLDTTALRWRAQWNAQYSSVLSLHHAVVARQDDAPNDYQTTLQALLWEQQWRTGAGTYSATLEHQRDSFVALATAWDSGFAGTRTRDAVALGYARHWGAHSLQLNVRNDQDNRFGDHPSGALAYALAWTPQWRTTLSAGTAFRAPTLEQVAGPYGSAALQPETNRSLEAGLRFADGNTRVQAVLYRNAVRNLISSSASLSTCAAGFFCYYNVGEASIRGMTLHAQQDFGAVQASVTLDTLDPRDDITGRVLSLRARQVATLGLDARLAGWQWGAQLRSVGERFDNAANTDVLGAYTLLDLRARRALSRDWQVLLRVDNATDRSYQEVGHYATPGRTLSVLLQWQSQP